MSHEEFLLALYAAVRSIREAPAGMSDVDLGRRYLEPLFTRARIAGYKVDRQWHVKHRRAL
jgi:hypothetical protein